MMSAAEKASPANQSDRASSASHQAVCAASCGSIIRSFMPRAMPFATGRTSIGTRFGIWLKISFSSRGVMAEPSA